MQSTDQYSKPDHREREPDDPPDDRNKGKNRSQHEPRYQAVDIVLTVDASFKQFAELKPFQVSALGNLFVATGGFFDHLIRDSLLAG